MNAGRNLERAAKQAQANANYSGKPRYLSIYGGTYWIDLEPVDGSKKFTPRGKPKSRSNPRRRYRRNGEIPVGAKKCTNCGGAGHRYEKIKDLGGRSGRHEADTFRVHCDACKGKGYVTQKDVDEYYASWKHNPRKRRYRVKKSKARFNRQRRKNCGCRRKR